MNFSDSWSGLIQISPIEGWFSSSLFSDIQFADIAASCGALATRKISARPKLIHRLRFGRELLLLAI